MSVLDVAVDKSSLSAKETRKLFKRGNTALNANNYPLAAKNFFKAWEADPNNLGLLTVVSHILSKLGHQAVAIEFLEKAIALHGLTEDICKVMGEMALSLEMFEAAEKIFAQAVQFNSQEEKYYINIATALEGQGNSDGAIEFMEEVVKILDKSSDCWCHLGTLYKNNKDHTKYAEAPLGDMRFIRAFDRALELNPNNLAALNNYAGGMGNLGVEELTRKAIEVDPSIAEPHVLLATNLLHKGNLSEGWKHYEYRNDPSRGSEQTCQYLHGLPTWEGQNLKGKSIFITSEQGIGDEVMFARGLKHIVDTGATVFIGCDERLVSIYERSFIGVKVYAHKDILKNGVRYRTFPEFDAAIQKAIIKVDYGLQIGSIPLHFWSDVSKIPEFKEGYLKADADLMKLWGEKLSLLGGKPKIGLSWRSGYRGREGSDSYIGLKNLLPLIKVLDADFICLQYDCREDELDYIEEETGKRLHLWPSVDLKQDIEANLAIISNMDIVIGPSIATQAFAMAVGAETLMALWGQPWWCFSLQLHDNRVSYAPNVKLFKIVLAYEWEPIVAQIIDECRDKLKL